MPARAGNERHVNCVPGCSSHASSCKQLSFLQWPLGPWEKNLGGDSMPSNGGEGTVHTLEGALDSLESAICSAS